MNNCTLSAKERQGTSLLVPARRDDRVDPGAVMVGINRIAGIEAPEERRIIARGETPGAVENNADEAPTGRRRPSRAGFRRPAGASEDSHAHEPGVAPLATILCPVGAEMVCSKPGGGCEDSA
jgi:hypothetical protein